MSGLEGLNEQLSIYIEQIRANFLKYTAQAFQLLPKMEKPCILDVGCGSGNPTMELARLTDGVITGIDTDQTSLKQLNEKISVRGLNNITVKNCSLFETNFPSKSFDIIWAEGVIHLLKFSKALKECNRLLTDGGFLVQHEANSWMNKNEKNYPAFRFKLVNTLPLPEKCWWTFYYDPLNEKIKELRQKYKNPEATRVFQRYQNEIDMVKRNPTKYDCAFYVMQKIK